MIIYNKKVFLANFTLSYIYQDAILKLSVKERMNVLINGIVDNLWPWLSS